MFYRLLSIACICLFFSINYTKFEVLVIMISNIKIIKVNVNNGFALVYLSFCFKNLILVESEIKAALLLVDYWKESAY